MKRGAVVVAQDPVVVTWNGQPVPLSPTEAQVYSHICIRGRVTHQEIDDVIQQIGANRATRSLVLGHIRGKFMKMGACDPFEREGTNALRLRVDPDEHGATRPVIGLEMPRYATAAR
ncbi:hypothetical protein [Sphingomonas sp. UYP23]